MNKFDYNHYRKVLYLDSHKTMRKLIIKSLSKLELKICKPIPEPGNCTDGDEL